MLKRFVADDVRRRSLLLPNDPPPHVGGYDCAGAPSIARPEPTNDTEPSDARRSASIHAGESQASASRGISHTNTCVIDLLPGFQLVWLGLHITLRAMTALVNADGQLTLPREVCDRLGLSCGQVLEVQTEGNLLLAWKKSDPDPFEKWRGRGRLPTGKTVDEYLRLARDGDSH